MNAKVSDPYNTFNDLRKARAVTPQTLGIPPRVVSGINSKGIMIRDGTNFNMNRVPDFEKILEDVTNNRAEIKLPERVFFVGAAMAATRELLTQPGVFGAQGKDGGDGGGGGGGRGFAGPTGAQGLTGAQGAQGLPGAPGAPGAPGVPPPPSDPPSSSSQPPGGPKVIKMDVDEGGSGGSSGSAGIAVLDRMQQPPPPPDQAAAMQQMIGNFQLSLIETERNRGGSPDRAS